MSFAAPALDYARANRPRFLEELKQFIHFPSVSVEPRRASGVRQCARWLAAQLRQAGLPHVKLVRTSGHPIVIAQSCGARKRPTLLVYGHYDVQPADPIQEWRSPPFEPTIRGEALFGRGASDDKGQLFVHIKAMESIIKTRGRLPVNVICLFDGEEEIGSPNLMGLLYRHPAMLAADAAVVSDTPGVSSGCSASTWRGSPLPPCESTFEAADRPQGQCWSIAASR